MKRIKDFLRKLKEKNYSKASITSYRGVLKHFKTTGFNKESIEFYQDQLQVRKARKKNLNIKRDTTGTLKRNTKRTYLSRLKRFLNQEIPELEKWVIVPGGVKELPKKIPSQKEILRILQQPDITTYRGIRDKAVLETLYSTGIRKSELIGLKLDHIDWQKQWIRITEGKGKKDRIIPINTRALIWIRKYIEKVRSVSQPKENTVFVTMTRGTKLGGQGLHQVIKKYSEYSAHKYRHSFATHLLQNGMKESSLQRLLGHSRITTTQVYLKVTIQDLKESYDRTHPRDRWKNG